MMLKKRFWTHWRENKDNENIDADTCGAGSNLDTHANNDIRK